MEENDIRERERERERACGLIFFLVKIMHVICPPSY